MCTGVDPSEQGYFFTEEEETHRKHFFKIQIRVPNHIIDKLLCNCDQISWRFSSIKKSGGRLNLVEATALAPQLPLNNRLLLMCAHTFRKERIATDSHTNHTQA